MSGGEWELSEPHCRRMPDAARASVERTFAAILRARHPGFDVIVEEEKASGSEAEHEGCESD